jgi:hypothetical protein
MRKAKALSEKSKQCINKYEKAMKSSGQQCDLQPSEWAQAG